MNEQQLEKLTEIFRILFNNNTLTLNDDMVATDVPGWDSFNHINLMISIEEEFGIKFTNEEVAKMQNVGELKNLLNGKLS
jgi:acyl carrier protein